MTNGRHRSSTGSAEFPAEFPAANGSKVIGLRRQYKDCIWPSPGRGYGGEGFSMIGPGGDRTIRITPSKLPKGALVVFAIDGQVAPPGTTERGGRSVIIRAGVMAPGGRVTCQP